MTERDLGTLCLMGPIQTAKFADLLRDTEGAPRGLGGTPVNQLARELHSRGHRLLILTLDASVKDSVVLEGEHLKIIYGPYRPKGRARDFFAAERAWLIEAVRRERPDLVHAHWTYEYAMAAIASGLPHLVTAHDAPLNILHYNFTPYRVMRTLMAYRTLGSVRYLTTVSPYMAAHLRRYIPYRRPIRVIPNGMPAKSLEARSQHRVGGPVTFGSILSGWSRRKNGKRAIEAFSDVRTTVKDCRLIMFGVDYGLNEQAQRWTDARGLAEGIEFAGQTAHHRLLERLRREVDILVHPALEESFGMAVLEGMVAGIPVVGGRCSGAVPWLLENGQAGVLVDVRQSSEIARAMIKLARDEECRRHMGNAGWESAQRRFHITAVTDMYLGAYTWALGREAADARIARVK